MTALEQKPQLKILPVQGGYKIAKVTLKKKKKLHLCRDNNSRVQVYTLQAYVAAPIVFSILARL